MKKNNTINESKFLKDFVKKNRVFLLSQKVETKSLRRLINDAYNLVNNAPNKKTEWKNSFQKKSKKISKVTLKKPSAKDIIVCLIEISLNGVADASPLLNKLGELPLIRCTGENEWRKIREKYQANEMVTDEDIISKIDTHQAYESAKFAIEKNLDKHFEEKLKEQNEELEKHNELIYQKQAEYDAIPSVLDIEEEDIEPLTEEKVTLNWWEKLYLKENPFPRQGRGLEGIDKSFYDEVYIKQGEAIKVLNEFEDNHEIFFGKGTPIVADFGNGKTTFIEYLAEKCSLYRIKTFTVRPSSGFSTPSAAVNEFYHALGFTISYGARDRIKNATKFDNIEQLQNISSKFNGIIIFLEDYHKAYGEELKVVFDFMAQLQPFCEDLIQEGLNVGFILSATPDWVKEIKENKRLEGFLNNKPIMLPEITYEYVCEIFRKRIGVFGQDRKSRNIQQGWVRKLMMNMSRNLCLRNILAEIVKQLEYSPDIVLEMPTELGFDTLANVQEFMKSKNKALFDNLTKISKMHYNRVWSSKMVSDFFHCIIHIYMNRTVENDSIILSNNILVCREILKLRIIQKMKSENSDCCFVLSEKVASLFEAISEKYNGLEPYEYLSKIFLKKVSKEKQKEVDNFRFRSLKRLLTANENNIDDSIINNVSDFLLNIEKFPTDPGRNENELHSFIKKLHHCLSVILTALFEIDGSGKYFFPLKLDLKSKSRNNFRVRDEESVIGSLNDYEQYMLDEQNYDLKDLLSLYSKIKDAACFVGELVQDDFEQEHSQQKSSYKINYAELNDDEINFLVVYQKANLISLKKNSLFESIRDCASHGYKRLSSYLHVMCSLRFGDEYIKEMNQDLKKYSEENKNSHVNADYSYNPFNDFTVPQCVDFFLGKNSDYFYNQNFAYMIPEKMKHFLNIFASLNISTSHHAKQRIENDKDSFYESFAFSYFQDFLLTINSHVKHLIASPTFVDENKLSYNLGKKHKLNQKVNDRINSSQYVHTLSNVELQETILNKAINRPYTAIDFLNYNQVEKEYGSTIVDIINSFNILSKEGHIQLVKFTGSRFFYKFI